MQAHNQHFIAILPPPQRVPDAQMSGAGSGQAKQPPPCGQTRPTPARPRTREDCINGPRPCPWLLCKWHLCWESREIKRAILSDAHPSLAASLIWRMEQTCVLDVAEEPRSNRELGSVLNVSHQAVAQTIQRAFAKLKAKRLLAHTEEEVCGPDPPPVWQWKNDHDDHDE